jgi:hypothetical protein
VTEAEWLACGDPLVLVEFLRGSPSGADAATWWQASWRADEPQAPADRRFRLFACACCRRIWGRIPEPCNRDAVVAVEEYSDGRAGSAVLEAALTASSRVEYLQDGSKRAEPGYWAVKYLGRGFYKMTAGGSALMVASRALSLAAEEYGRVARNEFDLCFYAASGVFLAPFRWPEPVPDAVRVELAAQTNLLRDVFGNPFRPVAFDPAWSSPTAVALADRMYESRDFAAMPVLADALMGAGCEQPDILSHCRAGGEHVRGCWAVDLVLGKG